MYRDFDEDDLLAFYYSNDSEVDNIDDEIIKSFIYKYGSLISKFKLKDFESIMNLLVEQCKDEELSWFKIASGEDKELGISNIIYLSVKGEIRNCFSNRFNFERRYVGKEKFNELELMKLISPDVNSIISDFIFSNKTYYK